MKIRPVKAEMFRADRRTDKKLMKVFLNFASARVKTKENKGERYEKVNEIMK
jgi:hypothetical protein